MDQPEPKVGLGWFLRLQLPQIHHPRSPRMRAFEEIMLEVYALHLNHNTLENLARNWFFQNLQISKISWRLSSCCLAFLSPLQFLPHQLSVDSSQLDILSFPFFSFYFFGGETPNLNLMICIIWQLVLSKSHKPSQSIYFVRFRSKNKKKWWKTLDIPLTKFCLLSWVFDHSMPFHWSYPVHFSYLIYSIGSGESH